MKAFLMAQNAMKPVTIIQLAMKRVRHEDKSGNGTGNIETSTNDTSDNGTSKFCCAI